MTVSDEIVSCEILRFNPRSKKGSSPTMFEIKKSTAKQFDNPHAGIILLHLKLKIHEIKSNYQQLYESQKFLPSRHD